jgi:hypothetical protein
VAAQFEVLLADCLFDVVLSKTNFLFFYGASPGHKATAL